MQMNHESSICFMQGKEGKTQRLPSVYCTPDVKRLQLIQLADAPRDEMKQGECLLKFKL